MSEASLARDDPRAELLRLYDRALPHVYGYVLSRCGQAQLAEDLTSEVFLAAVEAVRRKPAPALSEGWLVGVARHKLADHWRRQDREERGLRAMAFDQPADEDPWDAHLDAARAQQALSQLAPAQRAALTLRYVDDLAVADVASVLSRTVEATEALLTRAKAAFRRIHRAEEGQDA